MSYDRKEVYFIGIIDTLTTWELAKKLERTLKSIFHDSVGSREEAEEEEEGERRGERGTRGKRRGRREEGRVYLSISPESNLSYCPYPIPCSIAKVHQLNRRLACPHLPCRSTTKSKAKRKSRDVYVYSYCKKLKQNVIVETYLFIFS